MRDLIGSSAAKLMSVFMIVTLLAAASAMTMIGPRVYSAMARDGFLPKLFAPKDDGHPPVWSVLLQGGIAIAVAMTSTFINAITVIGTILTLMAALTVAGVFKLRMTQTGDNRPSVGAMICAAVFIVLSAWMLYFAFTSPILNTATFPLIGKVNAPLVWLGFIVVLSVSYGLWARRHTFPRDPKD